MLFSLLLTGLAASASAAPLQVKTTKRSSSSKLGAAYNDATLVSALVDGTSGTVAWSYNWGSAVGGDMPDGVEYVPMLWGADSTYTEGWATAVETALDSGSAYILGFNEPDMSSQADLSASEAAEYYLEYITPYSGDATLVSPAVTSSSTSGEGLDWFEEFMADCGSCEISALAVHWYGDSVSELKTFITEAITTAADYGISEVWLTEFALSSDEDGISDASTAAAFLEEAIPWLEEQDELTRYSYFYVADGYLLTDGVINSVGESYTSAASDSSSSSSSSSTTSAATTTATSTSTSSSSSTTSTSTSTFTSAASVPTTTVAASEPSAESSSEAAAPAATSTASVPEAASPATATATATPSATAAAAPVSAWDEYWGDDCDEEL